MKLTIVDFALTAAQAFNLGLIRDDDVLPFMDWLRRSYGTETLQYYATLSVSTLANRFTE